MDLKMKNFGFEMKILLCGFDFRFRILVCISLFYIFVSEKQGEGPTSPLFTDFEEMKDRILQLMKSEGMTQQEFSKATGIAPASLSSIFNGRTEPTMKHAKAVHRYFPRLSMEWLLFGEGEMFNLTDEELASRTRVSEEIEGDKNGKNTDGASEQGGTTVFPDGMDTAVFRQGVGMPQGQAISPYPSSHSASRTREGATTGYPQGTEGSFCYPPFYAGMTEMVKISDIKQRKIVEIRIFFDDGTFETFQGN